MSEDISVEGEILVSHESKSEFHRARTIAPFEVRSSSLWLAYNRDEDSSTDPLKMRKRVFIVGRSHAAAEDHYASLYEPRRKMRIVFFQLNKDGRGSKYFGRDAGRWLGVCIKRIRDR